MPTVEGRNAPSLLSSNGGNTTFSNDSRDSGSHHSDSIGRNMPWSQPSEKLTQDCQSQRFELQTALEQQAWQEAQQAAVQIAQQLTTEQELSESQLARMQQYFDSGDPILQAEAFAWSQKHPGWLRLNAPQCPEKYEIHELNSSVLAAIQANAKR